MNDKAGARSPLSLVFASMAIAICLLFLTGTLANLPNAALAAIVLVAVKLINVRELRHLRSVSRTEFRMSMAGVRFGPGARNPQERHARGGDLAAAPDPARGAPPRGVPRAHPRHPENEATPGGLIIRVEAALLYFNVEHVREAIRAGVRGAGGALRLVVLDLSSSPAVDIAGARMLAGLPEELVARGISTRLVHARASVRDILRAESLEERVGHIDRRVTVADVVEDFQRGTAPASG